MFGENPFRSNGVSNVVNSLKKLDESVLLLEDRKLVDVVRSILDKEGESLSDEQLQNLLGALRRDTLQAKFDAMWAHKSESFHPNTSSRAKPFVYNLLLASSVKFEDKMKWCDYLLNDKYVITSSSFSVKSMAIEDLVGKKLSSNPFFIESKFAMMNWAVNNRTGKAEFFLQLYGKNGGSGPKGVKEVDVSLDGILVEVKAGPGAVGYEGPNGRPPTGTAYKAWDIFFEQAAKLLKDDSIKDYIGTKPKSPAKLLMTNNEFSSLINKCIKTNRKEGVNLFVNLLNHVATGSPAKRDAGVEKLAKQGASGGEVGTYAFANRFAKFVLENYSETHDWSYLTAFSKDFSKVSVIDKNGNYPSDLLITGMTVWSNGGRQVEDFTVTIEAK